MTATTRPPCHGLTHLYFPDHKERPEATAERLQLCRKICAAPVAGALVIDQPSSAVLIEPLCATTDPVRFPCPAGVPTTIVVLTEDSTGWDCRYSGNGVCGVGHDPNHPDSWTVDGVPVDQATGVCAARVRSGFDCRPEVTR